MALVGDNASALRRLARDRRIGEPEPVERPETGLVGDRADGADGDVRVGGEQAALDEASQGSSLIGDTVEEQRVLLLPDADQRLRRRVEEAAMEASDRAETGPPEQEAS